MQSELKNDERIQIRIGSVVKEVKLLFPISSGGDMTIEPGDFIALTVINKDLWNKMRKRKIVH
jgi:hypothetical protein